METILVSLVSLALIIISCMTMAINTLQSTNKIAQSWKQMTAQSSEINRTDIVALPPPNYTGGAINLTVENEGQTNLSDFSKWDVIVQYQTGNVSYLAYTTQWAVYGIYSSGGTPEIFDTGVLDPGEQMIVSINLDQEVIPGQSCEITISTPNGVKSQTQVTRGE